MEMDAVKEVHNDIPKSSQDDRVYRGLLLQNDMKVLLISDPSTEKAAAAMDVHIANQNSFNQSLSYLSVYQEEHRTRLVLEYIEDCLQVGSMCDPKDLPGLAHFCEHMLFLGTEKYPKENAYTQFLTEQGGSSNAFTSGEHTNYFFDVKCECLPEALDLFAQFFLCPLFNADATDREVNAVDSENSKNMLHDMWRLNQLDRSTVDPSHPYCKFSTGNKMTLDTRPKERGVDVRDELLKFHSTYYSSNIMALCILGRESLDELTELVVKLMSSVEDKNVAIPTYLTHPYGEDQVQKIFKVVPVKDLKNLNLMFPIPDMSEHYRSKPSHYISHLIGHEGEGSLLSELKNRGWVNALVAGPLEGAKGFMFFMCNMELTTEGQDRVNEIISCVFQYLKMLQQQEPQEWVFEECQALADVQFRFKDKENPRNYVSHISRCIHDYSMDDVLQGQYLMQSFKPDLVKMLLTYLVPSKVRIVVVSKNYEGKTDLVEEWYGTEYLVEQIPKEQIEEWSNVTLNGSLSLPKKNEFIPTDLDIRPPPPEPSPFPQLIKDSKLSQLWFKQDTTFQCPKACMFFEITSPLAYVDPCHCNMASLFSKLLKDALNEFAYDAEIAGVSYGIENTMYGMCLTIKGYNHKQGILLQKILERMTNFTIDPKRFALIKERYELGLRNFKAEQPHQCALYYTSYVLEEVAWHKDELLDALEDVTIEKLSNFIPALFKNLNFESLIHGNVTKEEALCIIDKVEKTFIDNCGTKSLLPSQLRRHREIQLPHNSSYAYEALNEVHSNSCIEIYYQCELQATKSNMLLELFCQMISEPCFNELRTKEQLGYIVFSGPRRGNGAQGLRFIIQSEKEPAHLDSRVEAFLQGFGETVKNMDEDDFNKHVEALAVKRLEKPKKLKSESVKHWSEILSRQYNFDRDSIEVAFLRTMTKNDLMEFYQSLLAAEAPKRHKLAIHILSKEMSERRNETSTNVESVDGSTKGTSNQPIFIKDVATFKSSLPLFPLVPPYNGQARKSKL